MIRVLLAEDQQLLRNALSSLLTFEDDFEVAAEVADGQQAWEAIQKYKPDVCVLDIEMPSISGLELAEKVREANLPCKIVIVTTFARAGYLQKAMDARVEGYLLKDEPIEYFIESIRRVMQGERVISTDLAAALFMKEDNPLSVREVEVLILAKEGMTTDDMSKALYLSNGTVRNYLSSAIQKLEAESRQQAVKAAVEKGWI
ncbi:response regulator transcription factor [Bacillaceae bacterium SIJ1]|uniref:response regulator transcription factor n=1 Tax=Litoribacterium kuwaitense TaxID=1398745 RepID=UPI0013EC1B3E|nr:response regulator transcription factor [Litoribacterium kuwaitense]NGP45627.1 response regulator transcription factor [Litoribacterium kuwaitense]